MAARRRSGTSARSISIDLDPSSHRHCVLIELLIATRADRLDLWIDRDRAADLVSRWCRTWSRDGVGLGLRLRLALFAPRSLRPTALDGRRSSRAREHGHGFTWPLSCASGASCGRVSFAQSALMYGATVI